MGNTKFKVGDKVRVIEGLVPGHRYNGLTFCSDMTRYMGKVYSIKYMYESGNYHLDGIYNCIWSDAMLELVNTTPFTKADLKPGMVVEYRNGSKAVFINGIFMEKHGWMPISDYYDDLINVRDLSCSSHYDICRVYNSKAFAVDNLFKPECLELIWERKEVKEMTVAEIEEKLGYKVKVISDKED